MLLSIIQTISSSDIALLTRINGAHNPWMDQWMWAMTHTWPWIPLYVLMVATLVYVFRRRWWRALLILALTLGLSDLLSSGVMKHTVRRPRPSHNPELTLHLHERPDGTFYRGGPYGFPSSHAANSTTIAVLFYLLVAPYCRHRIPLFLILLSYVLLFCYTRVYLGVHYPSDIFAGWCLGFIVATMVFRLLKFFEGKYVGHVTLSRGFR